MPRISADQRIPALLAAVRGGRLPARPVPGRPSAGLGVGHGPDGLLVTGGPRTWRLGGAAGVRLGEVLRGRAADDREAELLHALGLWEADDPWEADGATPADATPAARAFGDPAVLDAALRFCGRWASTTRHHSSGAGAVEAWRQVRPVVVGDSALARALVRELAASWPDATGGRELLLVVDRRPDPAETRPQLPVSARGGTVSIGPWTEPGETPCPSCVAHRPPAIGPVTGDLGLLAALAVAEVVHTVAGIGRGARPGLVVEHTPGTGTTRARGLGPDPDCAHCAGRPARPDRAREAAAALPAVLLAAAPPRRWRAPAGEEVHYTEAAVGLQHAAVPGEPLTADRLAPPADPRWTEFLVKVAGRRSADPAIDRWAPSAGNLGAGALIAPGRDGALLVQPRLASDDPSALQAAVLPGELGEGGFGVAVDVARLVGKYGTAGQRIAAAEAGALLAQIVTAASAVGLRARLADRLFMPELPTGIRAFGGIEITPGGRRNTLAEAGLRARRSRRDLTWRPADRGHLSLALRRARARARTAGIDGSGIRLTLLPPGTAADVLMQPGLPGRAALLLAHTDLTRRTDPDVLRDAAALLALTALAGGELGLHSCLVHGLVPVAAAQRLGGGLIDRAALIGLVVGHQNGEGHG
ncbi:hypothetical protein [Kitasatospora aureofaciens]|uniref:hypothetical protein n=1 Tax=Kitasatospora aureofaciens TaxID=1894 RepID=UPI0037FCCC63